MSEVGGANMENIVNFSQVEGEGGVSSSSTPESSEQGQEGMTFFEARRIQNQLSLKKNRTSEDNQRLTEAKARQKELINDLKDAGILEPILGELKDFRARADTLGQMSRSGELKPAHKESFITDLQQASRSAGHLEGDDLDETYKGVRTHVMQTGLGMVRERARNIVVQTTIVSENPPTTPDLETVVTAAATTAATTAAMRVVEAQRRQMPEPPRQPAQPQERPPQSERERVSHFQEIHKRIMDPSTPPNELPRLRLLRENMYKAARQAGIFDHINQSIGEVVRNSDWNSVKENLIDKAKRLEDNARGIAGFKKGEWEGMVEAGVVGMADNISYEGFMAGRPDDDNWLAKHNTSGEALTRQRFRVDRAHFMKDVPLLPHLHDMVGASLNREQTSQQPDQEFSQRMETYVDTIFQAVERQTITLQQAMQQIRQTQNAAGARQPEQGISPEALERERVRWVTVAYKRDFYARFDMNNEPNFYRNFSEEERQLWDDMWQIHRAAFFKKHTAAFGDKAVENSDLNNLSVESIERVYNEVPGAREMMEDCAYVIKFDIPLEIRDNQGQTRELRFFDIEHAWEFEEYRKALRQKALIENPDFVNRFQRPDGMSDTRWQEKIEVEAKLADAVAWDMMWIFDVVESLDSRYADSASEGRHDDLPGVVAADDYRAVMHPQEKYEAKCYSGHYTWGRLAEWGATQMEKIKRGVGSKDEVRFLPAASPREFWKAKKTRERSSKGGRVVEIHVPEVLPLTLAVSFLEEASVEATKQDPRGRIERKKMEVLDALAERYDIDWKEVASDKVGIWNTGRFNKSVQLAEFYQGKKVLEEGKESEWVFGAKELLESRFKLDGKLDKMRNKKLPKGRRLTYQTLHNLKVWIAYASMGGVGDINKRKAVPPKGGFDLRIMSNRLSNRKIGYLNPGENLRIT